MLFPQALCFSASFFDVEQSRAWNAAELSFQVKIFNLDLGIIESYKSAASPSGKVWFRMLFCIERLQSPCKVVRTSTVMKSRRLSHVAFASLDDTIPAANYTCTSRCWLLMGKIDLHLNLNDGLPCSFNSYLPFLCTKMLYCLSRRLGNFTSPNRWFTVLERRFRGPNATKQA